MSVEQIIEVKDLRFSYGTNIILDKVNFSIKKGGYVGIIGPNGGGKTTLLRIMLGLLKPDSGEVKIAGKKISNALDSCRIGYVPQRISQEYVDLPATVEEIVESGLVAKESIFARNKDRFKKIIHALKVSGLVDKRFSLIGELSGGQRQKAFVARALVSEPQILILDEPFVGVDLSAQDEFYQFLRKLNKEEGITIIFVSHDIDMITGQAREILALNQKIVYSGEASSISEDELVKSIYAHKFTHIHHDR